MTITDWVLEVALGARSRPAALSFALTVANREITDAGYRRMSVKEWRVRDGKAATSVRFGPFRNPAAFDSLLVMAGSEVVEVVDLGKVSVSPGMVFEYAPSIMLEQVVA